MARLRDRLIGATFPVLASCSAQPAAPPATAQAAGRQCFLAREVNSYTPSSEGFIDVRVGASRYFRLQVSGGCPEVDWSNGVGIRPVAGGSWICEGYQAELLVPLPQGPQRCPVSAVTPITKEQYLAGQHH